MLTVDDHLNYIGMLKGLSPSDLAAEKESLLEKLGLQKYQHFQA